MSDTTPAVSTRPLISRNKREGWYAERRRSVIKKSIAVWGNTWFHGKMIGLVMSHLEFDFRGAI